MTREQETAAQRGTLPFPQPRAGAFLDDGVTLNPAAVQEVLGQEEYERAMREARDKFMIAEQARAIVASREQVTERLKALAAQSGVHLATLYNWLAKWEKGEAGLLRKRPAVVSGRRFTSLSADVATVISAAYKQPGRPKIAAVYKKTAAFCAAAGLPVPSERTVYKYARYLEASDPAGCCYAREGPEAWRRKFSPHGARAEPERVMQIVMGDHHKLDFFVEYNGRPLRPWVTMWFDVKSRCPVGWTVSSQANGQTIALALAHCLTPKKRVWTEAGGEIKEETLALGGLPEALYIDNGEDYKAYAKKGSLAQKDLDLCRSLGVRIIFATPYHPQAKAHVERFFGTLAGQFSPTLPGWCGAGPHNRPPELDEWALCEKGRLLSLIEAAGRLDDWIYNDYLQTPHSALGRSPLAEHLSGVKSRGGWPRQHTVNLLRCLKEKARVQKEGIRRFGRLYWAKELDSYIGTDVVIRYDPGHIGQIYVSTKRDGWIGVAECAELMKWDAAAEDVKKVAWRRRLQKKALRERLQTDYEKALSLEAAAAERKAAGPGRITGEAGERAGLIPAITPLDHLGKKAAEGSERAVAPPEPPAAGVKAAAGRLDPIEKMILGY